MYTGWYTYLGRKGGIYRVWEEGIYTRVWEEGIYTRVIPPS